MAKIGNEARLILKLVHERVGKLRDIRFQAPLTPVDEWCRGYDRCHEDYKTAIADIVRELEGK